jgi:hypothetical protein
MDIQFITDPYGVAAYLCTYMMKSQAIASALIKNAINEQAKQGKNF